MKYKHLVILVVLLAALAFGGCKKSGSVPPVEGENFDYDASYALGMNIGQSLGYDGIIPNMDGFFQGLVDQLSGNETQFDESEARAKIQEAYTAMMEKKEAEATAKELEFLTENGKKPGVVTTSSGLQYEVITEGSGAKPAASNMVRVHYEGTLVDGTVFDSSLERGTPAEFPLNGVISGWTEGLQLMGVGGKYRFYIPSDLGYGSRGTGSIPPHSTLIFEVELLDILDLEELE